MWYYRLEVRTQVVAARLELNDVPRWNRTGGDSDSLSAIVNPWITAGRNTLRLGIDWPEGVSYEPGRARVELSLEAQSATPGSTESRVLAKAEWPGKSEEAYPAAVTLEFDVTEAPPSRLWPTAAPIELTPPVQDEIRGLATRLHAACAVRNVDLACDLLEFRTADIARTVYRPAGEARNEQRAALADLLQPEGDAKLQAFHAAELELHPVARSRVIWVTGPDRAPAIQWRASDGDSRMPLYVAPIDGTWTVVR